MGSTTLPTTLSSTLSTFDKLIFDKLQIWKEERERRQLDGDKSESGILAGTSDSGDPTTLSTLSNTLTTLPTTLSTTLPTNEKLISLTHGMRIESVEKTIGKLSQRGAFCGYRGQWWSSNSVITAYDNLLLSEGDAGTLDASSGVWTTHVPGIYMVTWSLQNRLEGDEHNHIYLSRNGALIYESEHRSYISDPTSSSSWIYKPASSDRMIYEQGGRTMLLRLDAADTLSLRTTRFQAVADRITFCVYLLTAN